MSEFEPIIGIDLGTSNCSVGVWKNDRIEIIPNDQGNKLTPSYVAFTETGILIGEAAKDQAARNPENTVYGIKRLIGRKFYDERVQELLGLWPFRVVSGPDDWPLIGIQLKGEYKYFSAEEITAMLLVKLKENAEEYLGRTIHKAVITVPALFNDYQRQATKDAGEIAGLNVVRMINEATASGVAYGFQKWVLDEKQILIFDLGGGTLDLSLLTIEDGVVFSVNSQSGSTSLGGENFDSRMVYYCIEDFQKKTGISLNGNTRAIVRLKAACERAKRILSSASQASIEVDSLAEGADYFVIFPRTLFEEIVRDYLKGCLESLERVFKDSGVAKSQVHEILLVGGSSRIPYVSQWIEEFFNGKIPCQSINANEAVAYGATVVAEILSGNTSQVFQEILILDVTSWSLGVESAGGVMEILVPRNSTTPTKKTQIFTTLTNNQQIISINIFEGERAKVRDNHLIGRFLLKGIEPAPRGAPQIEVTLDIDANNAIQVSARDLKNQTNSQITITNEKGRLSKEYIECAKKEFERYKEEEKLQKNKAEARNDLESYIYKAKVLKEELNNKIREVEERIANNSNSEIWEYTAMKKEIGDICRPLVMEACEIEERMSAEIHGNKFEEEKHGSQNASREIPEEKRDISRENQYIWCQFCIDTLLVNMLNAAKELEITNCVEHAAILDGLDLSVQASTPGFVLGQYTINIFTDDKSNEELCSVNEVDILRSFMKTRKVDSKAGIRISNETYFLDSFCENKNAFYLKKHEGGACIVKTSKLVIFASWRKSLKYGGVHTGKQNPKLCRERCEALAAFLAVNGF